MSFARHFSLPEILLKIFTVLGLYVTVLGIWLRQKVVTPSVVLVTFRIQAVVIALRLGVVLDTEVPFFVGHPCFYLFIDHL
jgi:hypothetical protein